MDDGHSSCSMRQLRGEQVQPQLEQLRVGVQAAQQLQAVVGFASAALRHQLAEAASQVALLEAAERGLRAAVAGVELMPQVCWDIFLINPLTTVKFVLVK